jgi:hypothetical protein
MGLLSEFPSILKAIEGQAVEAEERKFILIRSRNLTPPNKFPIEVIRSCCQVCMMPEGTFEADNLSRSLVVDRDLPTDLGHKGLGGHQLA